MITFLPFPDFKHTFKVLDKKRLNNQPNETIVIYKTLTGQYTTKSWKHHPAVKMWKGYENALAEYYNLNLFECEFRGLKNRRQRIEIIGKIIYPEWLGLEILHSSHRSALLEKNYFWYGMFGWNELPGINYYWP